jgi:acetyltransferase-like isoleucine patch superfamily enzyme
VKVGKGSIVSNLAVIFNPENIVIGDNVRIDAFCVLSGGSGLIIGNHVHIGVHCSLFAGAGIEIGDFCGMSPYGLIMSQSDDFSGEHLVGPTIPRKYLSITSGKIILEKYALIGARSTVMCGVTLHEGATIGSHTLVTADCDEWTIYKGVPARKLMDRSRNMIKLADQFLEEYQ